jgi:hypothetical protein
MNIVWTWEQIANDSEYWYIIIMPTAFAVVLLAAEVIMLSSSVYHLPVLRNFVPTMEMHTATSYDQDSAGVHAYPIQEGWQEQEPSNEQHQLLSVAPQHKPVSPPTQADLQSLTPGQREAALRGSPLELYQGKADSADPSALAHRQHGRGSEGGPALRGSSRGASKEGVRRARGQMILSREPPALPPTTRKTLDATRQMRAAPARASMTPPRGAARR